MYIYIYIFIFSTYNRCIFQYLHINKNSHRKIDWLHLLVATQAMREHCLGTLLMKINIGNCSNKYAQLEPFFCSVTGIARHHVFAQTKMFFFGGRLGYVFFFGSHKSFYVMSRDESDPN